MLLRLARGFLLFVLCGAAVLPSPTWAASLKSLSPQYRHWIEAEVPYIISSDERKQFLSLATDQQRDAFIDAFWKIRNPDPGSTINTYKEEHYRRLAYANQHFGSVKYQDGWRTSMGRIYIILGPPKQRQPFHEKPNVKWIEIWFYEADTPALPPHFYVMFYKKSEVEDWRVYSPRMDGPVSLVSTGETENDPKLALKFIRGSLGEEAAKVSLTLIPGERADFSDPQPSVASDFMLATIEGLADNPITKERLELNRMRERVTTSVFTGENNLTLGYAVARDEKGRSTLSYLLGSEHADSRLVGRGADGASRYDMTLHTTIATADGKPVYEQEDPLTGKLTDAQANVAKQKRFGAEARLPLAPGKYIVEGTLTNNLNHIAARKRMNVTVPDKDSGLAISPLVSYAAPAAVPDQRGTLPFSMSKLRFTPRGGQSVELKQGAQLPLVFQLWLGTNAQASSKIHLRYVFGNVAASKDSAVEESEDVDASNHDGAGNLLTGRKLNTSSLAPGTYRLVVRATREGEAKPAYAAMTIHVIPSDTYADMWTAYAPTDPEGDALDDLKRGMSAEAQGQDIEARTYYRQALDESPRETRALDRLVPLLIRRGDVAGLATLGSQPALLEAAVDPQTLTPISKAMVANGKAKQADALLEAQVKIQPPNPQLYNALAEACEAAGNTARAREVRELAAKALRP